MSKRSANVYMNDVLAGKLAEVKDGYTFTYDRRYLDQTSAFPISLTLPLSERPYHSKQLFPFFKGLIPEGWLFDLNARSLKIDPHDEFGMLLHTGQDCVGAVAIVSDEENM